MRSLARIGALVALLGAQQMLAPLSVRAQVPDPCKPVAVPGLCSSPDPLPKPPGTSPSPSPVPGKGGGKSGGKSGKAQKAEKKTPDKKKDPFVVSGPNSTARLIEVLSPLVRRGASLDELLQQVVGPFPVAGPAWWTNDWHAPRSGGRVHKGLDIFAPSGTPLVAAADGFLSQKGAGGLCGISVEITDAKGIQYFYCHMSAHAQGLRVGQPITMGQVVGFVGNTGNAINTPSHVHFEFQPDGVAAPPKPHVDRWVKLAELKALAMLGDAGIELETVEETQDQFRLTRLFNLAGTGGDVPQSGDELLLLAGLQPAASGLDVAHRTLGQMAWEIDWGGQISGQLATLAGDYRAYLVSDRLLGLSPWPFEPASAGDPLDGYD